MLRKRFKPAVWTTLPFLNFSGYDKSSPKNVRKFMRHIFAKREHRSHIFELNMCVYSGWQLYGSNIENYVKYAISHNVQSLNLELLDDHAPFQLSMFSSKSLDKLTLRLNLKKCGALWDLPALTTLHLRLPAFDKKNSFSDSWLTSLPALTNLCLDNWNLSQSSFSFSLPALITLRLSHCALPQKVWDFPALISLDLYAVCLPDNLNDIFSTLVNLQNLTLFFTMSQDYFISCPPQLLNLSIRTSFSRYVKLCGHIVVSAPKLCNVTFFGIFTATVGVPELETVNIRLQGWFQDLKLEYREKYYRRLTSMLPGLGNAKNLTFDSEIIEALNEISDLLVSLPSPFYKLKCVKLPMGFKESGVSSALRSYLLGASPKAIIVPTSPQNTIPQRVAVPIKDQNLVLQEPLAAPTKELDGYQYVHIDALVEGTDKDQVGSSSREGGSGLWRSYDVNSEFECLLDRIMHKYPETFEHVPTKNKKLCTMNLNMLCTSLIDFAKVPMMDVDSDMIVGYKNVFSYLQNQGFNVGWVVNHLNCIEHLRLPLINELHLIDCHIDDAKTKLQELQARVDEAKIVLQDLLPRVDDAKIKLQDLQTLHVEKLSEIEKAFGTMGTNLAVGLIGDDLLSSP